MNILNIELRQTWDTLDEAIGYFLDLVLDLKAAQRFPNPPTDLFIKCSDGDIAEERHGDITLALTNL